MKEAEQRRMTPQPCETTRCGYVFGLWLGYYFLGEYIFVIGPHMCYLGIGPYLEEVVTAGQWVAAHFQ